MVLALIGIGIGIMLAIALILKLLRTPSYEAVRVETRCQKCGYKTGGLKCPRCQGGFGR